ncbi:hypothetical protein KIL84_023099 [Mauremys mutica]|uniref:Uncharacterized protein n=1 Tax=Mauremys mutica TaxID=74926 RepID=A0A9D4ARF1_9SAUR|nr:hypothetical protein KIL84_023099 [Mauremys mutica]
MNDDKERHRPRVSFSVGSGPVLSRLTDIKALFEYSPKPAKLQCANLIHIQDAACSPRPLKRDFQPEIITTRGRKPATPGERNLCGRFCSLPASLPVLPLVRSLPC